MSSDNAQATAALKARISQREAMQAKQSKNAIKGWPDKQTLPPAILGLPDKPATPYESVIFHAIIDRKAE